MLGSCSNAILLLATLRMRSIRTAARALIIHEGKLLTIKMRDRSGVFYILPGGGQNHGETLKQGLARECLEEIGTAVEIGDLLYVREYIGRNHEFRDTHKAFHQVEHVFLCTLPEPNEVKPGSELDKKQVGIEWLPIASIKERRILPKILKEHLIPDGLSPIKSYLGDVN